MATIYALQQVGVADSTLNPASRADGRVVNARSRTFLASKGAGVLANGDTFYCFKKPANHTIKDIKISTSASLGSSTIAVGIAGTTGKYVAARTFTTPTDAPTSIGPIATTLDDDPPGEEDIIVTVAVADIVTGTRFTLIFETCAA